MDSTDPLLLFRQVMWVSGVFCFGLLLFSLFLTRWRSQWLKLLDWEEAFWRRVGVKPSILRWLRKTEDNRLLIASVILLFVLHLLLFLGSVGAYLYFDSRLHDRGARQKVAHIAWFDLSVARRQAAGLNDSLETVRLAGQLPPAPSRRQKQ